MRRSLQAVNDRTQIEQVLQQAEVLRLGLSQDDQPYIVPVSFGYADDTIYIHGAGTGKKLEMLRRNSRVCFEVEGECEVMRKGDTPCDWSMRYFSVIGFGSARVLTRPDEIRAGLAVISAHYGGRPEAISPAALEGVTVIAIEIERMTGKVDSATAREMTL